MRTIAVLLAGLGLALVGVASAARTATVTVRDASFAPARVRVDAGGSVTWRNVGARSHRLASPAGEFAAFTLAPRARKTVRFTRTGAHPYTVDGSRCGVVYVGVALGPGCSGGGGGAPPPPSTGTKIYAYDVVIRGSFKNVGYIDDDTGRRYQTWTHDYTWSTTITNFKFKVVTAGAPKLIGVNATGRFVASTTRVTQKWGYFLQPQAASPPIVDCEGALTGVVRSRFFASASNSEPNYSVSTQIPGYWNKRSEIEASCNELYPPTEQTTPFTMADGTDVNMDATSTALSFEFERATGGLRNPAGALLNGRSFRINTGVKVSEETTCTGACSGKVKITERYIAIFTARRP